METKKNLVKENITNAKNTAIEELRVMKNNMIDGIQDVSDRLDEYNMDMVSIVAQDTEDKKLEVKYKYLDSNRVLENHIVAKDRAKDIDAHNIVKTDEIKTQLLNGGKVAIDGLNVDKGIDSKYVDGVKVPYKPLLWLQGGSIVDRYGLKPNGYDGVIFNDDGTFYNTNTLCAGQIVDNKYIWTGIGTSNMLKVYDYQHVEGFTMRRCRLYWDGNRLDQYGTILSGVMAVELDKQYTISIYDSALPMYFQECGGAWNSTLMSDRSANAYFKTFSPTIASYRFNNRSFKTLPYIKNGYRVQLEEGAVSTPWVYDTRSRADLAYTIAEDFSETYQSITFIKIYGKLQFLKKSETENYGNIHIITTFSNGGYLGERNLSAIFGGKMLELNSVLLNSENNILVYSGKVYVNGALLNGTAYSNETITDGIKDKTIYIKGVKNAMQVNLSEMLLFKDNNSGMWTDEFCKRVSKYGFSDELPELKTDDINKELKTDRDSTFKNQLYDTPDYIGFLKDQTQIIQGKLYRGVFGDKLQVLYCKTSSAWTKGTELATPDLVPYNAKSIKEGVL